MRGEAKCKEKNRHSRKDTLYNTLQEERVLREKKARREKKTRGVFLLEKSTLNKKERDL